MMAKNVLFINRQAPHGSHFAKEQLQMAMVFGAFEQHVSMLFLDDGVFSLIAGQQSDEIGFEDFSKIYLSLEKYYDIKAVFVEQESLLSRNLSAERLLIPAQVIDYEKVDSLMREQDFILST